MIKVYKSEISDPYLMKELLPCYPADTRDSIAKNIAVGCVSFTIFYKEQILAIIGASVVHDKCWGAWAMVSTLVKQYPLAFHKTMKKIMHKMFKDAELNRLHTTVDVDNEVAVKQNIAMGLTLEGKLRKVGSNGQDQYIFSLVRE